MTRSDRLREATTQLRVAYEAAYRDLMEEIDRTKWHHRGLTPEAIQSTDGRYILLDALTALVGAETALATRVDANGDGAAVRQFADQAAAGAALYWALYHAPADFWTGPMRQAPRSITNAYVNAQATFGTNRPRLRHEETR